MSLHKSCMLRRLERCLASILLMSLFSCGDDLPDLWQLDKLRVLNLKASSPEIAAGASTTITPLVSFRDRGSETLTYSVTTCPDPGVGLGAEASCQGVSGAVNVVSNSALTPPTANTGDGNTTVVSAPADFLDNLSSTEAFVGRLLLVEWTVQSSGGSTARAVRRIRVSTKTGGDLNSNPSLSGVLANGAAFTSYSNNTTLKLSASIGAGSSQNYNGEPEELLVSWYVTDGELNVGRSVGTGTVEFETQTRATGRSFVVVAVLRDGNGGSDHAIVEIP